MPVIVSAVVVALAVASTSVEDDTRTASVLVPPTSTPIRNDIFNTLISMKPLMLASPGPWICANFGVLHRATRDHGYVQVPCVVPRSWTLKSLI